MKRGDATGVVVVVERVHKLVREQKSRSMKKRYCGHFEGGGGGGGGDPLVDVLPREYC